MKRAIFGFALILGVNSVLFPLEETWLSIGANFGNYFESGSDLGNFYMGSPGINVSGYGFSNKKNMGMFFNYGFLFPAANTIAHDVNLILHGNFILGPGFRYNINENLKLHWGIGFDFNVYALLDRVNEDKETRDSRIGLGIGGDIGLKYDITDVIYINFGTTVTYNFANYRGLESTDDNWTNTRQVTSGWINNYALFGIKPYIAIGFNYYQEKGKWGKPE
jgi:hypothetical protein